MDQKTYLKNIGFTCQMLSGQYPLSIELLEKYEDEWDWGVLSSNRNLDWNETLIVRFRDRWRMFALMANPSIAWDEGLIKFFGKKIDWYYLSQNPALPIESFMEKYSKKIVWGFVGSMSRIEWSEVLLEKVQKVTSDSTYVFEGLYTNLSRQGKENGLRWIEKNIKGNFIPYSPSAPTLARITSKLDEAQQLIADETHLKDLTVSMVDAFKENINGYLFSDATEIPWSWEIIERYPDLLESEHIGKNTVLWKTLFSDINSSTLNDILQEAFPYRYPKVYELEKGHDDFGLVPSAFVETGNFKTNKKYQELIQRNAFWENPKTIPMELANLMEGPPRFGDHISWSNYNPPGHYILITDRLYELIQQFNLPTHKVYSATVSFQHKWVKKYGKQQETYKVIHVLEDEWMNYIDIPNTTFVISARYIKERKESAIRYEEGTFKTPADLIEARAKYSKEKANENVVILPELMFEISIREDYLKIARKVKIPSGLTIQFKEPLDLCWLPGAYRPMVSESLMKIIEQSGYTGCKFSKWGNDSIIFNSTDPDFATKRETLIKEVSAKLSKSKSTGTSLKVFEEMEKRRDKILERLDYVKEFYASCKDLPIEEAFIRKAEEERDVILPKNYRDRILLKQKFPRKTGYKWYSLGEIYPIGEDWCESSPQAVKAIAVAENGQGDYLGFLLKENSEFELSDVLVEFNHEIGAIEPVRVKW